MIDAEEIKAGIIRIRNFYNLKEIFSFLEPSKKFEIIIYNRKLQEKFEVNINDYKRRSGKYKKGEKNGKGCIFILNTDILIFEGEFLNGKRNGEGKEYYKDGKLKFEGKYLYGDRIGEGKEYFNKGNIKFEGEYLNGKRWNGKGYNKDGIMEFQIKDGK